MSSACFCHKKINPSSKSQLDQGDADNLDGWEKKEYTKREREMVGVGVWVCGCVMTEKKRAYYRRLMVILHMEY